MLTLLPVSEEEAQLYNAVGFTSGRPALIGRIHFMAVGGMPPTREDHVQLCGWFTVIVDFYGCTVYTENGQYHRFVECGQALDFLTAVRDVLGEEEWDDLPFTLYFEEPGPNHPADPTGARCA